jgi:hypothetical protein
MVLRYILVFVFDHDNKFCLKLSKLYHPIFLFPAEVLLIASDLILLITEVVKINSTLLTSQVP